MRRLCPKARAQYFVIIVNTCFIEVNLIFQLTTRSVETLLSFMSRLVVMQVTLLLCG